MKMHGLANFKFIYLANNMCITILILISYLTIICVIVQLRIDIDFFDIDIILT